MWEGGEPQGTLVVEAERKEGEFELAEAKPILLQEGPIVAAHNQATNRPPPSD